MKITVITATYNSGATLRDTLESVLRQSFRDFEHIVVDGGSKDNTLAIVREYEPLYGGRLRWVCELDKGIYDAMNKGIRMAMGDVVGIIEQAQKVADEQQLEDAERMLREGFTMDDLLKQMQQIRKMGGLQKILGMIPGMERAMSQMPQAADDSQMTRIEAIIHSMTREERLRPKIINGQRRKRIAAGSGRTVQEVNQLIKQWDEMNKMMGKM